MKYVIDIDNTISVWNEDRDYDNFEPIQPMIDKINKLYDEGHIIVFNTARGMSFYSEKRNQIENNNRPIIEKWLIKHKVKYHKLYLCKPLGDFYIDDKNLNIEEFLKI
ncbi:MAG: hypothetical protein QM489_00670 [Candidatus Izemoplasma sp.]